MKKLILLVSLFLISLQTFGQIKNGIVVYGLTIGDDINFDKGEVSEYYKEAKKNANYVSFTMMFNSNSMMFTVDEKLQGDNNNTSMALAFSGVTGKYYKEKDSTFFLCELSNKRFGEFIIKSEINYKWNFTEEKKIIDNYTCYKATTTIETKNSAGVFKRDVIAWYCPAIPISYGPKGFGGLPGLILELQDRNIVFGVKSVSLNNADNKVNITKPSGNIINESEYGKIIEENMKKIKDEK